MALKSRTDSIRNHGFIVIYPQGLFNSQISTEESVTKLHDMYLFSKYIIEEEEQVVLKTTMKNKLKINLVSLKSDSLFFSFLNNNSL